MHTCEKSSSHRSTLARGTHRRSIGGRRERAGAVDGQVHWELSLIQRGTGAREPPAAIPLIRAQLEHALQQIKSITTQGDPRRISEHPAYAHVCDHVVLALQNTIVVAARDRKEALWSFLPSRPFTRHL
eukprot:CAMPEP_0117540602 /NCGR_PEP_ID=MMETSP0784-20121206/43584_1 /TAXON_ID=39447 /ORGANISM="" /LENGTH=128 /DNA_ID=CAMNT_0005337263 /DNA_START=121 /DNA_END=508 /DNA_ORIENTATION=-